MPDIFTSTNDKNEPQSVAGSVFNPPPPAVAQPTASKTTTAAAADPIGSTVGIFSSFCMHPLGVKFVNQEDGEQIVLFIRRHVITNVPWILITVALLIAPLLVSLLLQLTELHLFTIPLRLFVILSIFYYLVVLSYALMHFINWFYHVGIVTPKRLLDLDIYNILNHHLAETEIADIVDVSYMQSGFFQSFFNYGNVPIQTEAIKANFEFEESPQPAVVSDIITDLRPIRSHVSRPLTKGESANA